MVYKALCLDACIHPLMFKIKSAETSISMSNTDQPMTIFFTPADDKRGLVLGGTISNMDVGSLDLNIDVGPSG